jgi:hypothetical protein
MTQELSSAAYDPIDRLDHHE